MNDAHMDHTITGYFQDADGQWVATLSCGHSQHIQHAASRNNHAWFLTETGRDDKIGVLMVCKHCIAGVPPSHRFSELIAG
jgi:Protein of unknown function (DUF3565)